MGRGHSGFCDGEVINPGVCRDGSHPQVAVAERRYQALCLRKPLHCAGD